MARTASVLQRFSEPTRAWFTGAFPAPTPAQTGAWSAIADGENTLVIAPTGSGKTLAAFLWAIDRMAGREEGDRTAGTGVLYISPLKALAVDVERNLRAPLTGITRAAQELGLPEPGITVGLRSGDTPAAQRRALVRTPPDILITTPESLYLMLTSAARETLTGVHTVIVDEVHAVAATKRGTHLALSLERLDALLERPAQRIGLSATVRPAELVADFLSGAADCRIVAPKAAKTFDLRVDVPVEDMANIPPPPDADELDDAFSPAAGSLWPHIETAVVDLIEANRSTIVFANSRRLAERLTARLNEIAAARAGLDGPVPQHNPRVSGGAPAQIMSSGAAAGAAPVLARAHHGSVSKEQRAEIEDDLKSGRLRCVVATSSLELGIDMGAVDLVVQVESPPSVAAGLQRVGRAGHQVGEISQGVFFPKHRTDLVSTTVTVDRMRRGAIEALSVPTNPLDILAQQTIAAAAVDDLDVEDWFSLVRRAMPYRELSRPIFEAVLDLVSGRFPSDEFAELRPRVTWDRTAGLLKARRGAQRLAVTSGGTIPDRGQFGVYLVGEKSSRVGELDEEMVYESRPGDVFALGASSWRIEDITHDRVLVTPAAGQPARLPFWIGDTVGRPAELGAAIGRFLGEIADPQRLDERAAAFGLTDYARGNLAALVTEQQQATGRVPTDRTLVVERFRDELGDWRVILHSPYGLRVHAPWAGAIAGRLQERLGLSGVTTATDDGIIVRMPDTDDEPPGTDLFLIDPDEIEALVTDSLADSAMFASRFRECAARALLLPRRDPGRRSPLWQQRQRSAALLSVASRYPDFPIILEAVRECLADVYDLPALTDLLSRIASRKVRIVEVETATPSPLAASMLFGYVGAFIYDDDAPLAERRAAALSLDTGLLAQLLGRVDLRELLDPAVVAETVARLQRLAPERAARDAQDVGDLLRWLGPLTTEQVAQRYRPDTGDPDADDPAVTETATVEDTAAVLAELHRDGVIISVAHRGRALWAAVEDTARLRDGLGVPPPLGVPAAFTEAVADPVGDLVHRYARTHGPFTVAQAADSLGMAPAVVADTLARLAATRTVVEGDFLPAAPDEAETPAAPAVSQWCHAEVLGRIRRGSLAAERAEAAPVDADTFARFLLDWHHLGGSRGDGDHRLRGVDGVAAVIEQLAGYRLPASAWESMVLPSRVADYSPSLLDELLTAGEVVWTGHGRIGAADGWIALHPADTLALTRPEPEDVDLTDVHHRLLERLTGSGALRYGDLTDGATATSTEEVETALWDLVWAGRVSNDSFGVVRAALGGTRPAPGSRAATGPAHRIRGRAPRLRPQRLSAGYLAGYAGTSVPPRLAGRWFAIPDTEVDPTVATAALCEVLLGRYGVITKGGVTAEEVTGGFSRIYKALNIFEDNGQVRRGYFIDRLGGAQFAAGATVDLLREHAVVAHSAAGTAAVLAATDPANPYGAALEWPKREDGGHRPGRKPGALVVLVDGVPVLFVERGGKTLLTFTADPDRLAAAATELAEAVRRGAVARLLVDVVDGEPVRSTDLGGLLVDAGFSTTPRGIRMHHDPRRL